MGVCTRRYTNAEEEEEDDEEDYSVLAPIPKCRRLASLTASHDSSLGFTLNLKEWKDQYLDSHDLRVAMPLTIYSCFGQTPIPP